MKKYSLTTLHKRLERLEERLRNEKLRLHHQIDNTGWGTGMRCSKCTPSFCREEELKSKIQALQSEIRRREAETSVC